MSAGAAQMLSEQLASRRREEPHVRGVPLHLHALADPAGRRAVVGRLTLDTAVEVDGPHAVAVVAKRRQWERAERRALLGEHRGDLPFRRTVDAGIGPARFPAIEIRLGGGEGLEAKALERGLLGVADTGFDLALPIRVADPAGQRGDPVVRQHVPVERIQGRVVDVGGEHPFPQIVKDDDPHRAAQLTKRAFVQLGPDLGCRAPHEQPDGLAGVAEGQGKKAGPAVAPRARVADHRPSAVVHLAFLARRRGNDHARLDGPGATQLPDKAADAGIAGREAVVVDQILPDRDGVAPPRHRGLDQLAVGLTGTGPRGPAGPPRRAGVGEHQGRGGRLWRRRVGGHLPGNGRFCRARRRPATSADRNPRRLEIGADRFTAGASCLFDAPERPTQTPEDQDLLSLLVAQDVAHAGVGPCRPRRRQRLSRSPLMAGFQVSINGRF